MSAADSELASMEDPRGCEDEEGSPTHLPSSVSPPTVPSSAPFVPTTPRPHFTSETVIETKAVSMASNSCSSALSSPAEASPAKPAVTSPTTFEGSLETSPATSRIASASDSLTSTGTSLANVSETQPSPPTPPSTTFGCPDPETDFPAVLTFRGVSVTLENNSVWKQFNSCGTEMILTKQGRRMFPYCRYRLAGLDPDRRYSLVLSIVPSDQHRYRWSTSRWEVTGLAEHPGLIRAFSHHYSPCRGSDWMGGLVSFYKLKLTNNPQDQDGHIVLHSMLRYIPRLHVIPVPDGNILSPDQPVALGPESMTFTFPQTEFMAVTTYQNFRITQLKINHNPFAKGFRDDWNSCRFNRVTPEAQPVAKTGAQSAAGVPAVLDETKEKTDDQSPKNLTVSDSQPVVTRLVLKPIMSTSAGKGEPFVPCIRGNHALGELVLIEKSPRVEPADDSLVVSRTPATSTPKSSPGYRRKKRRINRRWANSRGRDWKAATASPKVLHSPSTPAAVQPELDDVEGLLFVSFTSKEALEVHVREMPANNSSPASSVSLTTPVQLKQTDELPETHEKKIVRLEAVLLQDLQSLKHRQAIHPVLQAVGMKLSSLDAAASIDLRYLGVSLPLPSPKLPEQVKAVGPVDEGLPFISRTGKTSDMTKIKGWKNKFIRSTEMSPSNCDGSQKNLSAFCSNMLDEYLESEAQAITERAAAFSTAPEGSVAYQLPAKSSSYVKTLDSVLKHRNATSKLTDGANKPCPLSHKPSLYSALMAPAPPLARPAALVQVGAQSVQRPELLLTQPGTSGSTYSGAVSPRLSTHLPAASQRSAVGSGNSHGTANRLSGLTKCQLKLLQMENRAMNQGLSRTELTPERLSVALSVMLTKQALYSHGLKVPQVPKQNVEEPACGQDFCRLGCVCSSLQHQNRGLLLCRRPECMFGCDCFKRKISMQLTAGESGQPMQPFSSLANMEHEIKPRPGSQGKKLWDRTQDTDPEPLFAPKGSPPDEFPVKVPKRASVPRPTQPMREEDKDPVYKYLESFMTCARVREFNSKAPPVLGVESNIFNGSAPDTTAKLQQSITETAAGNSPKHDYKSVTIVKKAEHTSRETTSQEAEPKIQIEIQSACDWSNDHKMVLEALCRRMSQNRLSKQFGIGPYRIRPVAKICIRKPSGSLVTYRVHIRKTLNASDDEDDELGDSDEEKYATSEEDDGTAEEAAMRCGVTPFLSGVLPAGRLRARTKPVGCQAYGLIQVNGKSYNQARLLLGNMGSLHPANRLAAYVTGRLQAPADDSFKNSQKSDPSNKINTAGSLRIKAAGSVVPPVITARRITELKTSTQPPVQPFLKDLKRRGSINLLQPSRKSATVKPVQTFIPGQHSSLSLYQNSSRSSPVSLTVSPSLKTPSFLGQRGTYSFRICPPTNQSASGQKQQGVTLPGGFTLIELPKHGGDEATQQSESVTARNMAAMGIAPQLKDALLNYGRYSAGLDVKWAGLDTFSQVKELLKRRRVNSQPSTQLRAEKMPSDDTDEASGRQVETSQDMSSEDLSFDSSDDCGEYDEDDEIVDIETLEESRPGMAVVKTEEADKRALLESRICSYDVGSERKLSIQEHDDDKEDMKDTIRRKNHSVHERKRRSQQRHLFNKLQIVLQSYTRAPRLHLLSLALKEIQNLVETSRRLEEKKRRLIEMQAVYVKELSLLSGKPDKLIKDKLKDICEKQKMRENTMTWRPFFSHLLQSKAALLEAITPESNVKPTLAPFQATKPTSAALNSINLKPVSTPCSLPLAVPSPAKVEVTAPSLKENQPDEPVASGQGDQPKCLVKVEAQQEVPVTLAKVKTPKSQTENQAQVPAVVAEQLITAKGGASAESSTPGTNSPFVPVSQPFALPLIRSKTGRIILPSSLKPLGQGFYTLMVMKPKQNEKDDDLESSATMQSSDADTSKNPEKILSESSHPSNSESGHSLDESTQSPKSEPKRSHVKAPLVELSLLNKSVVVPLLGNSQKGKVVSSNATQEVAFFRFNSVCVDASSVAPEPDPSPSAIRCNRGRPPKKSVTPRYENRKRSLGEDTSNKDNVTSVKVEEGRSRKTIGNRPKMDSDNPVPVKRRRGRPPKKKAARQRNLHLTAASSPSQSGDDDGPFRVPRVFKSPNTKPKESPSARHLTRGSLGKDFPSAKKRSWMDVEKELEPELDSE